MPPAEPFYRDAFSTCLPAFFMLRVRRLLAYNIEPIKQCSGLLFFLFYTRTELELFRIATG